MASELVGPGAVDVVLDPETPVLDGGVVDKIAGVGAILLEAAGGAVPTALPGSTPETEGMTRNCWVVEPSGGETSAVEDVTAAPVVAEGDELPELSKTPFGSKTINVVEGREIVELGGLPVVESDSAVDGCRITFGIPPVEARPVRD